MVQVLTCYNEWKLLKAIIIQTALYWQNQQVKWNRTESPKMDPQIKSTDLCLTKDQRQFNGENRELWADGTEDLDIHKQTLNLNTDSAPSAKINSKWIIDLNVICKSIQRPAGNERKCKWPCIWQWLKYNNNGRIE